MHVTHELKEANQKIANKGFNKAKWQRSGSR